MPRPVSFLACPLALLLCGAQLPLHAQDAPPPADRLPAVVDMETVTVSGLQPGSGLWRVHRGDHTLFILGTQSPLPKGITWDPVQVRQVLAGAGAVLGSPGVTVNADVGVFRGLTMLPAARRAMRNPDGQTLEQLLPADLHARWRMLKDRHGIRDRGIEKKRPLVAAQQLYRAALDRSGLREAGVIDPVIAREMKQHGLETTSTLLRIRIEDPREALADFSGEGVKPEDIACFRATLDAIEHGLPRIAARANAWATGDIEALRAMPAPVQRNLACLGAWAASEAARKRGMEDIQERVRERWLEAAGEALATHPVSFATLSIDELLAPDGVLARLAALGDEIEVP